LFGHTGHPLLFPSHRIRRSGGGPNRQMATV
jgi:hypothetical protein